MVLHVLPSYSKDGCLYEFPTLLKTLDDSKDATAVRTFLRVVFTEKLHQRPHAAARPSVAPEYHWVMSMTLPLADAATPSQLKEMIAILDL
jgi:hypothetical protein